MGNKQAEEKVNAIVSKIKQIRLEQGLTYEKLADMTGLHRTAISLIEARKRQPSLLNCIKIADALNVNLKDIM